MKKTRHNRRKLSLRRSRRTLRRGGEVPAISSNVISIPELLRQISAVEDTLSEIKDAAPNPSSLSPGSIENRNTIIHDLEKLLAELNQKKIMAYNDLLLLKARLDVYSAAGNKSNNIEKIKAQINALETEINWNKIETREPIRGSFEYEKYPSNATNAAKKDALDAAKERIAHEIERQKQRRNKQETKIVGPPPLIENNYVKLPNVNRNGTRHVTVMLPSNNNNQLAGTTVRLAKARRAATNWLASHSPK
jgi:hypothetical protein